MDYKLIRGFGTATGTDAYVVAKLSVTYPVLKTGFYFIDIPNPNAGATTLKIDAFAVIEVLNATGGALVGSEIGSRVHKFYFDDVLVKFFLLDPLTTKAYQILIDAPTVIWDASVSVNAKVTITANRALSITNPINGQVGILRSTQGGAGGNSLALPANSIVVNEGGGGINLSLGVGDVDFISYTYDGVDFAWTFGLKFT